MSGLQVRGLSLRIGPQWICRGLDWQARPGESWGILGRNGVGKTSLLLTLAGLRQPNEGEILLAGRALSGMSSQQRARELGVMLQEPESHFPVNVLESVLIGRHPHLSRWATESAQDRDIARQALARVDLADFIARDVQTLSGGERRRVQFAQLLAQQTPVCLLDEPVNHLDIAHQHALLQQVQADVRQQRTAVLVLHDMNLAARYCSHVMLMYGDGRIQQGEAADLLTSDSLSELYQYPIHETSGLFHPA